MTPLPFAQHEPAPDFSVVTFGGKSIALHDYKLREELLLVALHGPSCPHCTVVADQLAAHRDDWESWGVKMLALLSDTGPAFDSSFDQCRDQNGAVRLRYTKRLADVAVAFIDRRGDFMDGWSLRHPEQIDWHEIAETARWVATQDHECPSCEVLPGYGEKGSNECQTT